MATRDNDIDVIAAFDAYLNLTEELYDRPRIGHALGYTEDEWEAFCAGWDAAMVLKEKTNEHGE